MAYIPRKLEQSIRGFLDAPEIIAVLGARQSGKTTMMDHLIKKLPKAISLSFEDRKILSLFEQSPDDFIAAYVKGNQYLFIDEFQYAKQGGKILKYIFDKEKIKIVISGSSTLEMSVHAVKYLVGRIVVFELFPFDFEEFLMAKDPSALKLLRKAHLSPQGHQQVLFHYQEYLRFGGYPRVVIEEGHEKKQELLRNIYNTYFLREVRDILGLIDDYKLQSLLKALSLQIGNLIDYGELGRVSGFSFPTLKKFINFLEKTYVCRFIRPFYKNKRTEVVKNPKAYFFDTGLRNAVISDFRKTSDRPDSGALLENGLCMDMIKKGYVIHFWRDKKQHELDFVIDRGNQNFQALEVKSYLLSTASPSVTAFQNFYPDIPVQWVYHDISPKLSKTIRTVSPIYGLK